jgi:hypothetical protein
MNEQPPLDHPQPLEPLGWYDNDGRLRGSEQPVAGKCGSQLRGTEPPRFCCKEPTKSHHRCELHGGATPIGIAHPSFKHGRRSRYLPRPLLDRYQDAAANAREVRQLDDEIFLLDARITELCERLTTGERGSLWDDLHDIVSDAQAGKPIDVDALAQLVARGRETEMLWREIDNAIASKIKAVSAEGRRMADMGEIASKDEVKFYIGSTIRCVKETADELLTDEDVRNQFFRALMDRLRITLRGSDAATAG